jgi:hypothetical protein
MGQGMTADSPQSGGSARETAKYIEHMARELRSLAMGVRLEFIAYLLSMVEDECTATARKLGDRKPKSPAAPGATTV